AKPADDRADALVSNSLQTITKETAQTRVEGAVEAWTWCTENGMVMASNNFEVEGGAPVFYEWLTSTVTALDNTQVLYETPAVSLILDPTTREVRGVYATQGDKEIAVKARKGVVVATGDYAANMDLMQTLHWPKLHIVSCGSPANTGDGMMLATAAGAQVKYVANVCVDLSDFAYRVPSDEMGTGISSCWYSRTDAYTPDKDSSTLNNSMIIVNMDGKRFMNEKARLQHNKSHNAFLDLHSEIFDPNKDYINLPMFMVCDDDHIKSGPIGKPAQKKDDPPYMWAPTKDVYIWSDDNQKEIEKGWIIKADTIEELAEKMKAKTYVTGTEKTISAEALKASIEKYNAGCEAGVDEFGRPTERIKPIMTPPFYAIEMCPCALYSLGWLASDGVGQVLDWNDEPMSRLYCAGNAGQGMYYMPAGVSICLGMGWVSGQHAASLSAWDEDKKK
ncbi:MAG: FAD-binding protein, partial [Raoultibacter sp.]